MPRAPVIGTQFTGADAYAQALGHSQDLTPPVMSQYYVTWVLGRTLMVSCPFARESQM